MSIHIYNPISIIETRLIDQEMSIVNEKDNANDKEKSSNACDTVSNIQKCKDDGIFDCIRRIKEYV